MQDRRWRRARLLEYNEHFKKDVEWARAHVGVPKGGFRSEWDAIWWDVCQGFEPVPDSGGRPEGWKPRGYGDLPPPPLPPDPSWASSVLEWARTVGEDVRRLWPSSVETPGEASSFRSLFLPQGEVQIPCLLGEASSFLKGKCNSLTDRKTI